MRKILVVGGTGLVGGAAAPHLAGQGEDVTIAGRRPPVEGPLTLMPFIAGSYLGKPYLVGDENWSFQHYFNLLLQGLGRHPATAVREGKHPTFLDGGFYGQDKTLWYEPDPAMVEELGYERHDIERVVVEMAPYYARRVSGYGI